MLKNPKKKQEKTRKNTFFTEIYLKNCPKLKTKTLKLKTQDVLGT
jgi:hypothetical protein